MRLNGACSFAPAIHRSAAIVDQGVGGFPAVSEEADVQSTPVAEVPQTHPPALVRGCRLRGPALPAMRQHVGSSVRAG